MLPFGDENVIGELYVMSLVLTARQAAAPVMARTRPAAAAARAAALPRHFPPFQAVTARDDRGTRYRADARGSMALNRWAGQVRIQPAPPAGACWLELSADGRASIRIDLTGYAEACGVTTEPLSGAPGEQLLEYGAQQILVTAADDRFIAGQAADGMGDVVRALEAAGALSPFSPAPGHLAMVCERLGLGGHGITARPTADLPEPWLSVLACYGRRHRPAVREGIATMAVTLPELDGARIALTGLHTVHDWTLLQGFRSGVPWPWPFRPTRLGTDPALGWWLRDDAGHWHVAVPRQHEHQDMGGGEASIMLRVVPPLGRETAACTVSVTTPTRRADVRVPLSWWASP